MVKKGGKGGKKKKVNRGPAGDGSCYNCGKPGHLSVDCPEEFVGKGNGHLAMQRSKAKAQGGDDCFICGEAGHRARECPDFRGLPEAFAEFVRQRSETGLRLGPGAAADSTSNKSKGNDANAESRVQALAVREARVLCARLARNIELDACLFVYACLVDDGAAPDGPLRLALRQLNDRVTDKNIQKRCAVPAADAALTSFRLAQPRRFLKSFVHAFAPADLALTVKAGGAAGGAGGGHGDDAALVSSAADDLAVQRVASHLLGLDPAARTALLARAPSLHKLCSVLGREVQGLSQSQARRAVSLLKRRGVITAKKSRRRVDEAAAAAAGADATAAADADVGSAAAEGHVNAARQRLLKPASVRVETLGLDAAKLAQAAGSAKKGQQAGGEALVDAADYKRHALRFAATRARDTKKKQAARDKKKNKEPQQQQQETGGSGSNKRPRADDDDDDDDDADDDDGDESSD